MNRTAQVLANQQMQMNRVLVNQRVMFFSESGKKGAEEPASKENASTDKTADAKATKKEEEKKPAGDNKKKN